MKQLSSTLITYMTKDVESIAENIRDSVEIVRRIKPIYNFKHSKYMKGDRKW